MTDIPKITDAQYEAIISMAEKGAVFEEILAYMRYTEADAINKRRPSMPCYDPKFCRALGHAYIQGAAYWIKQRKKENPKNWQYVMKNVYGWNGSNSRGHGSVPTVNYQSQKVAESLDSVIEAVIEDKISPEKAKVVADIIIGSHDVKALDQAHESTLEAPARQLGK